MSKYSIYGDIGSPHVAFSFDRYTRMRRTVIHNTPLILAMAGLTYVMGVSASDGFGHNSIFYAFVLLLGVLTLSFGLFTLRSALKARHASAKEVAIIMALAANCMLTQQLMSEVMTQSRPLTAGEAQALLRLQ